MKDVSGWIGKWLPITFTNNSVTVNSGSGDLQKDESVFLRGATAGHQLGVLTDMLNVLLQVPAVQEYVQGNATARLVRERFAETQARVELAKAGTDVDKFLRDPSAYFAMLDGLRSQDEAAFGEVKRRIRAWAEA